MTTQSAQAQRRLWFNHPIQSRLRLHIAFLPRWLRTKLVIIIILPLLQLSLRLEDPHTQYLHLFMQPPIRILILTADSNTQLHAHLLRLHTIHITAYLPVHLRNQNRREPGAGVPTSNTRDSKVLMAKPQLVSSAAPHPL
ncbi:uncharacterized protein GIQ15_00080 [Arthroderma uncinatum]|uniref:uncharacterized protein n=1 Tax=Arthroderma uncinatum TaxID=74035 RepID=UPI00144AE874|nr:uncharacterized protein GIQ15_00080 [Arthroderma uncinatum]KAF3490563.1 hypothetical protein GIQ15_00080 [Arthroderma uncinatum]